MLAFEASLCPFARANLEAHLHAVCCIWLRLSNAEEALPRLRLQVLDQVHEVMVHDWCREALFSGLDVKVTLTPSSVVTHFTSDYPGLADFLNSLTPAFCPLSDDDAITD